MPQAGQLSSHVSVSELLLGCVQVSTCSWRYPEGRHRHSAIRDQGIQIYYLISNESVVLINEFHLV